MTPADIRALKTNLYSTCDSIDDLIEKYDTRGTNIAVLMIGVNTVLEHVAKLMEAEEPTSG